MPPTAVIKGARLGDETELAGQSLRYARQVGQRLRAIRRQKKLSLQEVEASSAHEFKASVLGAYERGERVISVPRLSRLARYYNVPVDQLLPRDANGLVGPSSAPGPGDGGRPPEGGPAAHGATRPDDGPRAATRFRKMNIDHNP
ncbi:MAG: helix-turn-helix domain-containing protein, partial [Acidimicrobiales bacterium]